MGDEETPEKTNKETTAGGVVMVIVLCVMVFAFGCLVGHCEADPKPQEYSANTIYKIYHVEMRTKTNNGRVGYAMVGDEDGSYKIIKLPNICMKNYRPKANILRVLNNPGCFFTCAPCQWLITKK